VPGLWIPMYETLTDHPKLKRLRRGLQVQPAEAVGTLALLWLFTIEHAADGDLSGFSDEDLADAVYWAGEAAVLVRALTQAGFLDGDRQIHDWPAHVGRFLEQRAHNAERQARWRARRQESSNGVSLPANESVTVTPALRNRVTGTSTGTPSRGEEVVPKEDDPGRSHTARGRARGKQDASRTGRRRAHTVIIPPGQVVAISSPEAQAYLAECAAQGIPPNYG